MDLFKIELKKIISTSIFLFALIALIIFSAIIFIKEISLYKRSDELIYRNMCRIYEGKVDNDYINKMNLEAEKWDKKLLAYDNIEEDYLNGKISAIEFQSLLNNKENLLKQKQIFDEICFLHG